MSTWKNIKDDLSYTFTKSTFNTYIAPATATVDGDTLTICFKTQKQREWAENRLAKRIESVAASHGIQSVTYTVKSNAPHFTAETVYTDPTRQFVPVSIYALRFWQPLLGKDAFALWMTLRAFAWDSKTKAWASIETLADICANGNRHKITGRAASKSRPNPTIGALDTLQKYNFARVNTTGSENDRRYTFRVLADPPLLTPEQAAQLSPRLQQQHRQWLERHRINRAQWELLSRIKDTGKEEKSPAT